MGGSMNHSTVAPTRGIFDRALSLPELIAIFRRRLRLFAVVAVGIAVAVVIFTLVFPPLFTASATVKVDPASHSYSDIGGGGGNDDLIASTLVDSEVDVAQSRDVAAAVVDKFNLVNDPDFNGALKPGFNLKSFFTNLFSKKTGSDPGAVRDHVIDAVQQALDVKRDNLTFVFSMNVTTQDAQKSARLANGFAQEYIAKSTGLRARAIEMQAQALNGGADKLAQDARQAAAAAAAYTAQHGVAPAMGQGTAAQQQATSLAIALSQAKADEAAARAALTQAETQMRSGGVESVDAVLQSPVIQELRGQRAQIEQTLQSIAAKYGPKHPTYIAQQQAAASIDAQIRAEAQRIIGGLRVNEHAAEARVTTVAAELGKVNGQVASDSQAQAAAQTLEKTATSKQELANQYAIAQQNANQQKSMNSSQAVIVTAATPPLNPSFPNKALFALLGGFLGCVVGASAVFVAETLDAGLISSGDVEEALGRPLMAYVPALGPKALKQAGPNATVESYVLTKPMSAFAEAFRSIRSALLLSSVDHDVKVVAITSSLPGEGKSAAAISLARVLGLGGARVVVVDCDIRRGVLGRVVNSDNGGVVEVLTGKTTVQAALVKDSAEGVWVLPAGKAGFTPHDLFGSEASRKLLEDLKSRFDYVILDTPPVLAVSDARVISKQADAVVFVCRWSKTPRRAAAAALSLLDRDGAPVAGVVLTMVDMSARRALSDQDGPYYQSAYSSYYNG
jgi:capsular exopolysaccharide synthesis family protein